MARKEKHLRWRHLKAGRLTDDDLTREVVTVAKANRAERHAARIVGPMP